MFDPVKATFPARLTIPSQQGLNIAAPNGSQGSASSSAPKRQPRAQADFEIAWSRAVSVKRPRTGANQRAIAVDKIQAVITEFPEHFMIVELIKEDQALGIEGSETLHAVLLPQAPATIIKHAGPLRTFMRWMFKHCFSVKIDESSVWRYVQCVLKDHKTAPSTMSTTLKAVRWSYHTLGLKIVTMVFSSPRIHGAVIGCLQDKNPWRPAPALTVAEVLQLHDIANNDGVNIVDRAGAAHFLGMLYGRCRASDVREIASIHWDRPPNGPWDQGFIEMQTLSHKTARLDVQKHRMLPIVLPGRGIAQKPFGDTLIEVRTQAGLPMQLDKEPFLPAPKQDELWTAEPLESCEISKWLQGLLPRPNAGLTSHSLKATLLVWCCKFGLSRESRRVLGRHADSAAGSDAVYGRDIQAQALRELEVVLSAVRAGFFHPDATRSGVFSAGHSRDTLLKAAACEAPTGMTDPGQESDEALEVLSESSAPEAPALGADTYWSHPQSTIVHRRVAAANKFACGRPFLATYPRVSLDRAKLLPQCKTCFHS